MARFKVDRSEVVQMWIGMRACNPQYTKRGLARFFGITPETVNVILREAVSQGKLPASTFTTKYARKNQSTDS